MFARLVSEAERLRQELARHDRQVAAAAAEAAARPVPAITPQQAGYPVPFLSPAEQARRRHARQQLQQRLLADFNAQAKAAYLPAFLRQALASPLGNLRLALPKPLTAGGRDCFMPKSFWQSQNPDNIPGFWSDCCNTCKRMIIKQLKAEPLTRVQVVVESHHTLVLQSRALQRVGGIRTAAPATVVKKGQVADTKVTDVPKK